MSNVIVQVRPKREELQIRAATAGDAEAICGLLYELGFPGTSDEVATRLKAMPDLALVATWGDRVVGLVTTSIMPVLHRPTSVGRLSALVVSGECRGSGIGRALVEAAEQELQRRGCALVEVTSNIQREDAHAFYKHLGYELTSHRFKKELRPVQSAP